MIISPGTLAALFKSFNTLFNEAMSAAKPQYQQIAMVVPSNTKSNGYVWLGAWPKMREWLGEREVHKLEGFDYTIKNKHWESTVEVDRDDISDDTYGVYAPLMTAMGASAAMHPDEIVFDLLNNAFAGLSYDGKAFFATNHASGSNKGTAALSFATGGSYSAGKIALAAVKDSKGNPLFSGTERDILVVGSALEEVARMGLNNDFISVSGGSTQSNIWKNSSDLVVSPRITSATAWFLLRPFAGLRALIFQQREVPQFQTKDDPQTSDIVFMRKKYLYGSDCRDNAGYGLHQLAYGSTGAA